MVFTTSPKARLVVHAGKATQNNLARIEVLNLTPPGRSVWRDAWETAVEAEKVISAATGLKTGTFHIDKKWWARGCWGNFVIWVDAEWAADVRAPNWNDNDENREEVARGVAASLGWERSSFRVTGAHTGRVPWIDTCEI